MTAIAAAKARLEERQRQADTQRGRSPNDECRPVDKDGKPKAGKPYKRDFGVPESKARDNFTDPESRIMKRAGGGRWDGSHHRGCRDRQHPAQTCSNCPRC